LKEGQIDISKEYIKLFELFYGEDARDYRSQADVLSENFIEYPYRGTCLDIYEFEEYCGFNFDEYPAELDTDLLVSICEFIYNVVTFMDPRYFFDSFKQRDYIVHINRLIDKLGYVGIKEDDFTIFVPKDTVAIEVSKSAIIPDELSYRVLEYNHHSLKGNLNEKKQILLAFGNLLEPHRGELKKINKELEDDLFFILNNFQIRHNNNDRKAVKHYNLLLEGMSDLELENYYDELYQLCLMAFMTLENQEWHRSLAEIKNELKVKKQDEKEKIKYI